MNVPLAKRLRWGLHLALLIVLSACMGGKQASHVEKVGMHIDAVLEFVIEYPLDWTKDRRLTYGSVDGEVRWTSPDNKSAQLRVLSHHRQQPGEITTQALAEQFADEPGLVVFNKEKTTIAAGEAWHLSGQTGRADFEAYLVAKRERIYRIVLTTPPASMAAYDEILERVRDSFAPLPGRD